MFRVNMFVLFIYLFCLLTVMYHQYHQNLDILFIREIIFYREIPNINLVALH